MESSPSCYGFLLFFFFLKFLQSGTPVGYAKYSRLRRKQLREKPNLNCQILPMPVKKGMWYGDARHCWAPLCVLQIGIIPRSSFLEFNLVCNLFSSFLLSFFFHPFCGMWPICMLLAVEMPSSYLSFLVPIPTREGVWSMRVIPIWLHIMKYKVSFISHLTRIFQRLFDPP